MKHIYTFILLAIGTFASAQNCATLTDATNTPITSTSPVMATLVVPDNVVISDINVTINLLHSFLGDLNITLMSPTGTSASIFAPMSCSGANITNATFDDDGSALVCDSGIMEGTYQSQSPLAIFNGENAGGTWTLMIVDAVPLDDGVYQSFSLEYCSSEVLSIEKTALVDISIYPNPTTNILNINLGEILEATVEIYDILGKSVISENITNKNNTLDLALLNSGAYVIVINDKKGNTTSKKFLKN